MATDFEKNFWNWFLSAEESLKRVTAANAPILKELSSALQAIDPDLNYELTHRETGVTELIVSANGIRELIPVVDSLLQAAPTREDWTFTALRPRRSLEGASIQFGEVELHASELQFSLSEELQRIDVTLYLDSNEEEHINWLETIFLLLDAAIGERYVAEYVGEVFIRATKDAPAAQVHPFTDLPAQFDSFLETARRDLATRQALPLEERRSLALSAVMQKAEALVQQLIDEPQSSEYVTIEAFFQEDQPGGGATLLSVLENTWDAVAEELDQGSVNGETSWIHAWFDIPSAELPSIQSLIQSLAEEGYSCKTTLSGLQIGWSETIEDISNLLCNLETLADAGLVLEAHQAIEHEDPQTAVSLLEEALLDEPDNLEVRALLAYAYAKLHDKDMAEACLDELREDVDPKSEHPAMFWNIACAYALLAEAQQACENLRLAIELDPELRELAIKDPDLSKLRGEPEFDELLYQA